MVLERCRPGRVQGILGKTKLLYFGPESVSSRRDCEVAASEFEVFRDAFFACDKTAKSALVSLDGTDSQDRRYVAVALYTEPEIFDEQGEQSPVAGFGCLYDDRSFTPGSLPPSPPAPAEPSHTEQEESQTMEETPRKKEGFFRRLFG